MEAGFKKQNTSLFNGVSNTSKEKKIKLEVSSNVAKTKHLRKIASKQPNKVLTKYGTYFILIFMNIAASGGMWFSLEEYYWSKKKNDGLVKFFLHKTKFKQSIRKL